SGYCASTAGAALPRPLRRSPRPSLRSSRRRSRERASSRSPDVSFLFESPPDDGGIGGGWVCCADASGAATSRTSATAAAVSNGRTCLAERVVIGEASANLWVVRDRQAPPDRAGHAIRKGSGRASAR